MSENREKITYDTQKLQEWKAEYDKITVPGEALERVKKGIQMAEQETEKEQEPKAGKRKDAAGADIMKEKRNKTYVILKRAFATAAAILLVITGAVNLGGSTVAHAIERIPVIGTIAKVVTFRSYEDTTNHFEADIKVPQIEESVHETQNESQNEGKQGEKEEQELFQKSLENTNKTIEEYAQSLIDMYESDLAASNGEGNYSLKSDYEIVRETDKYLVLRINTLLVMAGGAQSSRIFNIDKITGEILKLDYFFQEDSNYADVISDNIKEQMLSQMEKDENVTYFIQSDEEEWGFDKITDDTQFYFADNGDLVISFDEYEVAPGFMGAVDFTIPRDKIAGNPPSCVCLS